MRNVTNYMLRKYGCMDCAFVVENKNGLQCPFEKCKCAEDFEGYRWYFDFLADTQYIVPDEITVSKSGG